VEHANFTFIVDGVSRALLAQITRSRIASFSVMSQRYVEMDDGMTYIIPPAIMDLGDEAIAEYAAQMCTMHQWYKGWRDKGIEAEDARFVTPQACETRFVVTMNARELLHLFSLRTCERSQWEIRYLVEEMLSLCQMACPEIFMKAGPSCVQSGKCPEGKRSCGKKTDQQKAFKTLYDLNKAIHEKADCDTFPAYKPWEAA
jgi:thymidylate synthase (FAD)